MAVKKEVALDVIEKAKKTLAAMPSKIPEKKIMDEALQDPKPTISDLYERGYSKDEVAALLTKQGVAVKKYQLTKLFLKPRAEKTKSE
jgi:hypothetical protein